MVVEQAAEVLGYRFKDKTLLNEALTHASSADHRLKSNERLEFLGDAILGFVVCEYLYQHFPGLLEGEMTKIKSTVVSRKVCARVSRQINLSAMLNLGKGIGNRSPLPGSIAAAVLESIIAAIYIDGGLEAARAFILEHLVPFIREAAQSTHQHNFKSVLQQYAQRHLPTNPVYLVLDEKGPDHSKYFEVCVQIEGEQFQSAWGKSKKEAEQKAALHALCALNIATITDDDRVVLRGPMVDNASPDDSTKLGFSSTADMPPNSATE